MSKQVLQGMAQTRRAFIGQGALAFLAAAGMGHRAFGATGPARLRFGVLSDIHITRGKGSCDIFEKALERARATSSRRPWRTSATRRWTPC